MGDNRYKMLPLILLSQMALSIAAPAIQCDISKIAIAGGKYCLNNGTKVGSKLEYTCPEGTYPYPFPSRECLFNGQWSNENVKAQCRTVQCTTPGRFENGEFYPRKAKYFIGDILYFECWGGFKMSGPENRICQANGKWSGIDTTCDNKGIVGSARHSGKEKPVSNLHTDYRTSAELFHAVLLLKLHHLCASISGTWGISPSIEVTTGGLMNIFILLDASESLGEDNFNIAKEASKVFIEKMSSFDFSPRYAVISYDREAKPIIELSDEDSKEADKVIDRINAFQYSEHTQEPWGRNTRGALAKVYEMLCLQNARDPEHFLKMKNVILLITEGKHNMGGDPTVEVKRIREILDIRKNNKRENYLDIYVFGLGEEISDNEINDIASKKTSQHVFSMETVEDMKKAFDEMIGSQHVFSKETADDMKKAFNLMIDEAGTVDMCGLAYEPSENEGVEGKYPWIAKITITSPGSEVTCKGSIISRDFILTAAHCFNLDEKLHAISVEVGGKEFKVKNLHRHNKYNPLGKQEKKVEKSFDYDLALIELKTKIEFSRKIR
ncbi:complement factor B-like [Bufo bufo]|uniref:complement factor B-like n=1 Tax=Bufo bufo TaxID=8384 RepID=UPI001ABE5C06|nr:complement factor B-like [Bufo bufo]